MGGAFSAAAIVEKLKTSNAFRGGTHTTLPLPPSIFRNLFPLAGPNLPRSRMASRRGRGRVVPHHRAETDPEATQDQRDERPCGEQSLPSLPQHQSSDLSSLGSEPKSRSSQSLVTEARKEPAHAPAILPSHSHSAPSPSYVAAVYISPGRPVHGERLRDKVG